MIGTIIICAIGYGASLFFLAAGLYCLKWGRQHPGPAAIACGRLLATSFALAVCTRWLASA